MPEMIKPENDNLILRLATTVAAPIDSVATNAARGNQHKQVTKLVIDKVSGSLLKYGYLIKVPNAKIWERALANYLIHLEQGFG